MTTEINIRTVPIGKITSQVIARTNAVIALINIAENTEEVKKQTALEMNIALPTLYAQLTALRQIFQLPARTSLKTIADHPQLRQAIESILVPDKRVDKGSLRSGKNLWVVIPNTGEELSAENFLKLMYARETVDTEDCYCALLGMVVKGLVTFEASKSSTEKDNHQLATKEDLPARATVRKFLKGYIKSSLALRSSKMRKHDFETQQQPYVTRDIEAFRPGEMWLGDHTELDFMVLNDEGKPDRRWITAFMDIRTRLLVGYYLSWQPNSETIALAFRAGVLGSQLRAFTGTGFEPVNITNLPENVLMDNGKDYRSNYTQRVFGKIDFDDHARLSVQRITKLHYSLPYHGQSKAELERWFGIFQKSIKMMPGYKGNFYQKKPDTLARDLKSGAIMKVADFDAWIAVSINCYNNHVRKSLKDQTPLQCYLTNQTAQRSIDQRVLDFLMMKAAGRKIRRCQVTMMHTEYYSEQLMQYNDKLADVYYDPNDLGLVSIYVDGAFAAVASNKDMFGQSERGWEKILHDRKRTGKELREEVKQIQSGIGDHTARMMALEGRLLNMEAVPGELLKKNPAHVSFITGLENQAAEVAAELQSEKRSVDARKKRDKVSYSPLTLAAVQERIK